MKRLLTELMVNKWKADFYRVFKTKLLFVYDVINMKQGLIIGIQELNEPLWYDD